MNRKLTILTAVATIVLAVSGCELKMKKNLPPTSVEEYGKITSFERIRIKAACEIRYRQADETKVTTFVKGKYEPQSVTVKSDGEWLFIEQEQKLLREWKKGKGKIVVEISSPDLIEVDMRGAGTFQVDGNLDTDTLLIRMKGAGKITIPSLVCDRLQANLKGVGSFDFGKVTAQYAQLGIEGVGNIRAMFHNSGSVGCSLRGVGNITLSGNAEKLTKNRRGTGRIDTSELKINGE